MYLVNGEIIAVVPLRGGSKSIPNKNIRPFCGKPLCEWTLRAILESGRISRTFVSTDSDAIAKIVSAIDSSIIVHHRPDYLATDEASTEDTIVELLEVHNIESGYVLIGQATSPQTKSIDIVQAIDKLFESGADSLVTCTRSHRFFWNDNGEPLNYDPMHRPMRQQWPGTLMENGAFYISQIACLRQGRSRLHGKIAIFEMDQSASIELDEAHDWLVLEEIFRRTGRT